ncbi:hypothetical protein C4D60_Mb07t15150 [Musa balbisiana]|uniref:Uncharacterized protein n=1 Tax=Musa balbisiana TaxID=52838 RepID=A0A4S8JHX1_MUSBA|nr:hypothetical protein C4D60_Mb07t15150 [Musa balbisiana]
MVVKGQRDAKNVALIPSDRALADSKLRELAAGEMTMKQEPQGTPEVQPSSEASHDLQGDHQNSSVVEAPKAESGSASVASSNSRKVSREDIELNYALTSSAVNLPMGYPVLPQHPMPATVQPHVDPMGCGLSSCHVVNGIPAPGSFHPIRLNSGTNGTTEATHTAPPCSASMSEMAVSPASVASSNHFPFTPEISGIGMDASALDTSFPSDMANSGELHLGPDGVGSSRDSIRSLGQLWNFSLSDLTADLTNLGGNAAPEDLGVLGDYDGSPFLPSDSDILLDSPEQDDIGNLKNTLRTLPQDHALTNQMKKNLKDELMELTQRAQTRATMALPTYIAVA